MSVSVLPYVPKPPPSPKTRPTKAQAMAQLQAMQRTLFETSQDPEVPASSLAQVARAWSELEERKRILRMKPKPKDVDVSTKAQPKSRTRGGFTEDSDSPLKPPTRKRADLATHERKPDDEPSAEPRG